MTVALETLKKEMAKSFSPSQSFILETLEERIAPAGLDGTAWKPTTFDTPILLTAGQGLSTSAGGGGDWLLKVDKGQALVFLTDLNGNGQFDVNEITGISAGDGLRLTSFVDINGDIVTNLNANGTLTDFDATLAGNDGRVLLNSKIESIVMRSLTSADSADYIQHMAATSYSIYGSIYAGNGFGVSGGGLVIDTVGWTALQNKYSGTSGNTVVDGELYPSVGYIMTGTAASGMSFSFGTTGSASDIRGYLTSFSPAAGQAGGDIIGVKVGDNAASATTSTDPNTGLPVSNYTPVAFKIGGVFSGNGGSGARGGDIKDVTIFGDIGSFYAVAGNGGNGVNGGAGGSIVGLTDLGSHVSMAIVQTGDGGEGYNGKGGNGGTLTLGQFSTRGTVNIELGNGGDGTTGGGTGSGLASGAFTPVVADNITIPLGAVTTYREAGDIGTTHQVDFNGDGIGDVVFFSQNPNQLVVRLGVEFKGTYGVRDWSPTYYLESPLFGDGEDRSSAVVIGDFDGDGNYDDIATASSAEYSRDGINVFLWNETTKNFDFPLRSAIPLWSDYMRSGGAITDIAVGDFNDDGILDLALVGQYQFSTTATGKASNLAIMTGTGDGYFYADFVSGTPNSTIISGSKGHTDILLAATATQQGVLNSDILVAAMITNSALQAYEYANGEIEEVGGQVFGKYRDRSFNTKTDMVEFGAVAQNAVLVDFTVMDVDGDGIFDVVSLNDSGVVVAFKGAADGNFAQVDGNKGIFLTGEFGVLGEGSEAIDEFLQGVVTGNFDANTSTADFSVYSVSTSVTEPLGFYEFNIDGFEQTYDVGKKSPSGDVRELGLVTFTKPSTVDDEVVVFSSYQGLITDPTYVTGYVIGTPNSGKASQAYLQSRSSDGFVDGDADLSYNSFLFEAGDGGDSQLGAGGAGGSIGSGVLAVVEGQSMPKASITLLIPGGTENALSANFTFVGGDGGSGMTAGGAGGSISGIATRYTATPLTSAIQLYSGNGGDSVQGKGGKGGDISKLNVQTLEYAEAGDAGSGVTGGDGGSILGNGIAGLFDTEDAFVTLLSGDGGDGIKTGGNGGNVSNFKTRFLTLIGGSGGELEITAGSGGDAIAGKGGTGGSILNVSPDTSLNALVGNVFLTAGAGGNGLTGGNGGSVNTFVNANTQGSDVLHAVSVIAGNGGYGVSSTGGRGGDVLNIVATGTGNDSNGNLLFNRFIAGQGGNSFGATGGDGGNLSGLNVSSTSSSIALAAGAAGYGLVKGGTGGSVLSSAATSQGADSKTLIIAGDGGSAFGFTASSISSSPTTQDVLRAFGGVNGTGGNGGSISIFRQEGGISVSVDLIAGNGGNLINYGNPSDSKTLAGKGGSITNTYLAGNAGDVREDKAILSYNAYGTSMGSFVTDWLLDENQGTLDSSVGNVGVVAGASGRVSGGTYGQYGDFAPATGVNGSVTSFKVNNIMSMVAGSVDRISAITVLSGVSSSAANGTVQILAKKTGPFAHTDPLYYAFPDGAGGTTTNTAAPNGALIDGAILVKTGGNKTTLPQTYIFPKV